MKKLQFIFCISLFGHLYLNAQTNTYPFPSTGNVGIGTSNPTNLLTLQGDNKSLSVAFDAYNYSTAQTIGAQFGAWSDNSAAGIKFHRWLGGGTSFHTAYIGQSYYNGDYGLDFRTDNLSFFNDATTSRMYISATTGNVGIGASNPSEKLDVAGTIQSDYLRVNATTSTEGGEIKLNGPNSFNDWNIDNWSGDFRLHHSGTEYFRLQSNGYLGIGTATPDAKLTVKGNIHTNEVKVDLLGAVAPDYVFYKDYDLKSLKAVEDYIASNGHLPNIPSAKDMETEGIMLKEMNLKLLEKIEELTLYTINQEKRIETLEKENTTLKTQEERIAQLEEKIKLLLNKK